MMPNCIGVDINPLACKISSAKTTIMTKSDIIKIQQILDQISTCCTLKNPMGLIMTNI